MEPKLNLPLKLSAPSLEACVDALTYCMLAAKRGRSSLWGDFPEFATTWLSPPSSPGGEMVAERLPCGTCKFPAADRGLIRRCVYSTFGQTEPPEADLNNPRLVATSGFLKGTAGKGWPASGKGFLQPGGGERPCRFAKALPSPRGFERRFEITDLDSHKGISVNGTKVSCRAIDADTETAVPEDELELVKIANDDETGFAVRYVS